MVNRPAKLPKHLGQGTIEFVLMLSLLTAIGLLIMRNMVGSGSGTGGAVNKMSKDEINHIASDERR